MFLVARIVRRLVGWLAGLLNGRWLTSCLSLIGLLIGWLAFGCLVSCMDGRLVHRLFGWSIGCCAGWFECRCLVDSFVGWLVGRLVGWLVLF